MLVLNVIFKGEEGKAERYVKELEENGMADFVRHEKGNYKYDYYLPLKKSGEVLLVERWENEECLQAHLNTENIKKMQEIKKKYNIQTILEKYRIE